MTTTELNQMSDAALVEETKRVVELERRSMAQLLALLIEVERRRLPLALGLFVDVYLLHAGAAPV